MIVRSAALAHFTNRSARSGQGGRVKNLFVGVDDKCEAPGPIRFAVLYQYHSPRALSLLYTSSSIVIQTFETSHDVGLFCERVQTAQEQDLPASSALLQCSDPILTL